MRSLCIFVIFVCNTLTVLGSELARGYNDDIDWVSLKDGRKLASEQKKPVLLLIHKSWCGACKALKPKFATDMEIEALSKEFVMINIMDDEDPGDRQFSPDGGYIPRVLFANSNMDVLEELKNESGNPQYKYFYPEPKSIHDSMVKALKIHKSAGAEEL